MFTPADKAIWPGHHPADTPDVVILGEDWLLAIEAKMFHNPSAAALNKQMKKQRVVVDIWAEKFGFSPDRVAHVLLLPEGLAAKVGSGVTPHPILTWGERRSGLFDCRRGILARRPSGRTAPPPRPAVHG